MITRKFSQVQRNFYSKIQRIHVKILYTGEEHYFLTKCILWNTRELVTCATLEVDTLQK